MQFRQAEARDVGAFYAISLATGLAGGDASHLYDDRMLLGHIYSAPYVCLEPRLALVVEDEEGISGFAVGALDTEGWEARLEREWWPSLRARYVRPDGAASSWSPDQRRAAMIHSPGRTPASVLQAFPAHLHLNLLPRLQARSIGSRLFDRWLALARTRGAGAIHVGVNRENGRALRFWAHCGFQPLTIDSGETRTIWMGRLAPPT